MLQLELDANPRWGDAEQWQVLGEKAVAAALAVTPYAPILTASLAVEVSIALSDNAAVQALNAQYRRRDAPTNVLSFPMVQSDLLPIIGNSDDGELLLGDIILAYETCVGEAQTKAIPLTDHAAHLFVHGALHLLGYDHANDHDADRMERLEQAALASMGIADPYAEPVMTPAIHGAAKN